MGQWFPTRDPWLRYRFSVKCYLFLYGEVYGIPVLHIRWLSANYMLLQNGPLIFKGCESLY